MIIQSDVLDGLRTLDEGSVRCCITSPPYWGLRDYGVDGQLGLEKSPDEYAARLVEVFREVRRVLRDDGTLWLNLGDSYASSPASGGQQSSKMTVGEHKRTPRRRYQRPDGLKPKDLVGFPWLVAFALRADGWYLRSEIVWAKPNPMPESVRDRPTKAHEYVFLLAKSAKYFYDHEAVKEEATTKNSFNGSTGTKTGAGGNRNDAGRSRVMGTGKRNLRTVWTVTPKPFRGAHFAVMPEKLVEPCLLAGSAVGDTVLDPFAGSGTVGVVAKQHGRHFVGIELNPEYAEMARKRISNS